MTKPKTKTELKYESSLKKFSITCLCIFLLVFVGYMLDDGDEKAASVSAPESPADALFKASARGILSEVKAALSADADPGARDGHGNTPLHMHMIGTIKDPKRPPEDNANPAVIKALIEAGADPNARGELEGRTPLHIAAMYNHDNPSVIKALIEAGADPNARNQYGETPLHNVAQQAYYTKDADTSLIRRQGAVILALIEGGADTGARDERDKTPFDYVKHRKAFKGTDAYRMLKAALPSEAPSVIAIGSLIDAAKSGTASEVKAALSAGANAGMRNRSGATLLHLAATHNANPSVILALIEAGVNADARMESFATPLHLAATHNANPSVILALIEGGADPGARMGGGITPLHLAAAKTANPSVILALIEGGADPGARDDDGKIPFDYAKGNKALKGTDAYRMLNEGRFK